MDDEESEVNMERTLDQLRRQKRMEQEKRSRGLLQRMAMGRAAKRAKTTALAAMLSSQALGGPGAAMREPDLSPEDQQKIQQQVQSPVAAPPQFTMPSPEEEEEQQQSSSPGEQIDRGRELYRQTQAARRASNQLPATLPSTSGGAAAAEGAGSAAAARGATAAAAAKGAAAGPAGMAAAVVAAEGEKKIKSALQKFRNKVRNNKSIAKAAAETADSEVKALANKAILKSMRTGWTIIHETLEETALSFVDIMLISGPLTIGVFILRLCSPMYGRLATVRFKGVEVPLIPSFTLTMLIPRGSKTLLIAVISFCIWSAIIMLFYFATHPIEALKFITKAFLDQIT